MKNLKITFAIAIISLYCISCKSKLKSSTENIPTAVSNVLEAKKLLIGKTWKVIDVSTIAGSYESRFEKENANAEAVVAPDKKKLNWIGEKKSLNDTSDWQLKFIKEAFEKYEKISFNFTNDSLAIVTGGEAINQSYVITDSTVDKEQKGLKLKLTYTAEATSTAIGAGKFTATYYVLGANDKYLYLLTPNKLNSEKLVFLLRNETK